MGFLVRQNRGRNGAIFTPTNSFLFLGGSYVCVDFAENRSRNATVRVLTEGQIHTDRRKRIL